ncbi:MAG: EAL domain-containing protein [Pseudomonadota bacterium]
MGAQAVRLSNVDIDNALKNKDFEVLFQPIFDLGNGALARMETFVRWRHPSLGVLPPGAFISFFESQGRMSELTRYVLAAALKTYRDWRGPYAPGFSINLAYSDLSDDAFGPHFTKLLREYDFPAHLVTLECPMPPVDADLDAAATHFKKIAKVGARLAIEVRGRANDFLKSVDPFPFDEIKTGGSAILRFARTVRGPGLTAISDLLDIAHKANAAITAVGVEDQASLAALRGLGFTAAQGNHLGKVGALSDFRPSRVNEVRELLSLDPLSAESISQLFRTEAPPVRAPEEIEQPKEEEDDALIERLNARLAAQKEKEGLASTTTSSPRRAATKKSPTEQTPQRKRKLDAARAKLLAQKAREREVRKAAAIARAKSKAAQKSAEEQTDATPAVAAPESMPAGAPVTSPLFEDLSKGPFSTPADASSPAPRAMQDLLSEEFARPADAAPAEQPAHSKEDPYKDMTAPTASNEEEKSKKPADGDKKDVKEDAGTEGKRKAPARKAAARGNTTSAAQEDKPTPDKKEPQKKTAPAKSATSKRKTSTAKKAPAKAPSETSAPVEEKPAQVESKDAVKAGTAATEKTAKTSKPQKTPAPEKPAAKTAPPEKAKAAPAEPLKPEKTEEPAKAEVKDAKKTAPAPSPEKRERKLNLSVKNAPAFLSPEYRVTGPAEKIGPAVQYTIDNPHPVFGPPDESTSNDGADLPAEEAAPETTDAGNQDADDKAHDPRSIPEIIGAETMRETAPFGEREDVEEKAPAPPKKQSRRRKKNFLMRKYRIWPTHFWPASWRRAQRRRSAEKRNEA